MGTNERDDDEMVDARSASDRSIKRVRVSQACEPCRAKKCKCDGQYPVCSACRLTHGQVCSYDPNPKKRGLPAGQNSMLDRQVRILELICASLYDRIEYAVAEGHLPAARADDAVRPGGKTSFEADMAATPVRDDDDSTAALLSRWRICPISRLIEDASRDFAAFERFWDHSDALLKPLLPPKNLLHVQTHPTGEPANLVQPLGDGGVMRQSSPFLSESTSFVADSSQQSNTSRPCVPKNVTSGTMMPNPNRKSHATNGLISHKKDTTDASSQAISSSSYISHLPNATLSYHHLPRNTTELLNIYFTYTHTWLPMVDKFKLVSFAHRFSKELSSPSSSAPMGRLAILWAILAYASFQTAAWDGGGANSSYETDVTTPEVAYRTARALIPAEDQSFELEHVQALILLSLINIGRSAWTSSWLLVGMAGRVALDLDLGSKLSHSNSYQRRTFLACLVVDGLISARLNRSPQLHKRQLEVPKERLEDLQQLEEEGWEEWSLWEGSRFAADGNVCSRGGTQFPIRSLNTFNQFLRLIYIMNEIISIDHDRMSPQTSEKLYAFFSKRLQQWKDGLEPHCTLTPSCNGERSSPHVLNLHMMYWNVFCLLRHRLSRHHHNNTDSTTTTIAPPLGIESHRLRRQIDTLCAQYRRSYTLRLAPPTFVFVVYSVFQYTKDAKVDEAPLSDYLEEIEQTWATPTSSSVNGKPRIGARWDGLNNRRASESRRLGIINVGASRRVETTTTDTTTTSNNNNNESDNALQVKTNSNPSIMDLFETPIPAATSGLSSSTYSLDTSPGCQTHYYRTPQQQQAAIDTTEISGGGPHQVTAAAALAAASQQQDQALDLPHSRLLVPPVPEMDYMNSFDNNSSPTPKSSIQQQHLNDAYPNPTSSVQNNNTLSMVTSNVDFQYGPMVQIREYPPPGGAKAIVSDLSGLVDGGGLEGNLAALDAIDWTDDRFMKNLGYNEGNVEDATGHDLYNDSWRMTFTEQQQQQQFNTMGNNSQNQMT